MFKRGSEFFAALGHRRWIGEGTLLHKREGESRKSVVFRLGGKAEQGGLASRAARFWSQILGR